MDLVASHMRSDTIKVFPRSTTDSQKMPQEHSTHTLDDDETHFSEKTTHCYPNPSHDGKVKLSFTLDSPKGVAIQMFNTIGNLVWSRNLSASETVSGVNVLNWEGINKNGLNLSSGIYLCRITVEGKSVVRKIAIIR
jgi:flagellar hook assembly protein FlgD